MLQCVARLPCTCIASLVEAGRLAELSFSKPCMASADEHGHGITYMEDVHVADNR
jgi:hypothetical protein